MIVRGAPAIGVAAAFGMALAKDLDAAADELRASRPTAVNLAWGVERALAAYIRKVGFQEPPYTISRELLAEFRAVAPPEYQYLIADLFEEITLYENRAISATYRAKGNGRYEVTLKISAKKFHADGLGAQKEDAMDDQIDIGVFGEDDKPLYLRKHRIPAGETTLTMVVDARPVRAGIDPVVKLVDRNPDDNTVAVTQAD